MGLTSLLAWETGVRFSPFIVPCSSLWRLVDRGLRRGALPTFSADGRACAASSGVGPWPSPAGPWTFACPPLRSPQHCPTSSIGVRRRGCNGFSDEGEFDPSRVAMFSGGRSVGGGHPNRALAHGYAISRLCKMAEGCGAAAPKCRIFSRAHSAGGSAFGAVRMRLRFRDTFRAGRASPHRKRRSRRSWVYAPRPFWARVIQFQHVINPPLWETAEFLGGETRPFLDLPRRGRTGRRPLTDCSL